MEILMVVTLALMGFYFIKSTDLPKDMKERSAQFHSQSTDEAPRALKITLPKNLDKTSEQKSVRVILDKQIDAKLAEMKQQKRAKEIQVLNDEIDKLTIEITSLEQEIKLNNERNNEIQSLIDAHLISLQLLQEKITFLS